MPYIILPQWPEHIKSPFIPLSTQFNLTLLRVAREPTRESIQLPTFKVTFCQVSHRTSISAGVHSPKRMPFFSVSRNCDALTRQSYTALAWTHDDHIHVNQSRETISKSTTSVAVTFVPPSLAGSYTS